MRIELIEDPDFIRRMGYAPDTARTQGVLHLSEIYRDLMCDLQPTRFKRGPFIMNARVEAGILFESILEQALAAKFSTVRPGEIITSEGVYMSPDGVNPSLIAGEEYKATWKTSRYGITDEYGMPLQSFLHWFFQMKGYAYGLDIRRFLLRVFFVNGNYSRRADDPEDGPTFKTYDIEFTSSEIEENWAMLMNHAKAKGMLR
jgi:hypothetical protein